MSEFTDLGKTKTKLYTFSFVADDNNYDHNVEVRKKQLSKINDILSNGKNHSIKIEGKSHCMITDTEYNGDKGCFANEYWCDYFPDNTSNTYEGFDIVFVYILESE